MKGHKGKFPTKFLGPENVGRNILAEAVSCGERKEPMWEAPSAWVLAGARESSASWDVERTLCEETQKAWPIKTPHSESEYRASAVREASSESEAGGRRLHAWWNAWAEPVTAHRLRARQLCSMRSLGNYYFLYIKQSLTEYFGRKMDQFL